MSRSNIYVRTRVADKVEESSSAQPKAAPCLDAIKAILVERPTYGYRRVTAILRKQGFLVNYKRIYRTMRMHGLLLQAAKPRPARTHKGKVITLASNMRWCSDAFGLQCSNGDQVQVAFALDCCDREVISWVASSRGINGRMVTDLLAQSIQNRFGTNTTKVPSRIQWLTDNGPCYVARETVAFARAAGFEVCTTPPYSPQSNGMAEALVKTIKRDYAYVTDLPSASAVLAMLEGWFEDYNSKAPHKGLRWMAPRDYRDALKQAS